MMKLRYVVIAAVLLLGCHKQVRPGSGNPPPPGGGSDTQGSLPRQAQPCASGRCASGLTCLEFFGIAGPSGPKFTSCEIRCGADGECAGGQKCITIADGPGEVCRPVSEASAAVPPGA